jgi:hypothetical protein
MRVRLPALLLATALTPLLPAIARADAQPPVLKRVMLSTAGIGYFEHTAEVDGNGTIRLTVPFDQVDDVLKSLIVLDPTGQVLRVTLPGREPDLSNLADLPVPAEALQGVDTLLAALNGQEVIITGNRTARGRVISLQERYTPAADTSQPVARRTLALMTGDGLLEIPLTEGLSVQPADPALAARLTAALKLTAAAKEKGSRELSIEVAGTGKRSVRFGYVAAAPLWKSSYRLDLAANGTEGRLQGWAILENKSGQDWKDVQLTLSSGNPVTFRQELYRSYDAPRPILAIDLPNRTLPPVDDGSMEAQKADMAESAPRAMPAPAPAMAAPMKPATGTAGGLGYVRQPEAPPAFGSVATAAANDGETQLDLTLPAPVSVTAGQSLMVPITDSTLPARSMLVYRPGEQAATAAVELTNSGQNSLPPGALALYRGNTYVGDGRLATLPKGDTRFIAYAEDGRLKISSDREEAVTLTSLKAAKGLLTLERRAETRLTVRIAAPAGETRPLVLELPKSGGKLDTPPEGLRETATGWRIPVTLKPGETVSLPLVSSRVLSQQLSVGDFDLNRFIAEADQGRLPQATRDAFRKLAELRGSVSHFEALESSLETQAERIFEDQKRLRENLAAVPANSDLARRYLKQMNDSEDALAKLNTAGEKAAGELEKARKALTDYITGLTL